MAKEKANVIEQNSRPLSPVGLTPWPLSRTPTLASSCARDAVQRE